MTNKDTLKVTISDLHSGGSTALFPNRFIQFTHTNYTPTSAQVQMFKHFDYCAGVVAAARKGKRLIVVHDGDAIDGDHHNSLQNVTRLASEQRDIHEELMSHFLKRAGFTRGDQLYYVKGTAVHVEDEEDIIGRDLGAVQTPNDLHAWDELRLPINDKRFWWVHKGPNSGKGANKGNSFRNWLRDRFYECINEGIEPPHFITTGHVHDPYWQVYIGRYQGEYFPVRGLICPSWQLKTRYAYGVAPLDKNKIGLQFCLVSREGTIGDPVELLMA